MFQSWVVCWAFSKVGGADLPCYMGKTFAVEVSFPLEAFLLIKFTSEKEEEKPCKGHPVYLIPAAWLGTSTCYQCTRHDA